MSLLKHLVTGMFVFGLLACGGGGGGDSINGDPVVNDPPPDFGSDPDPIVYNGVSTAAVLAGDNIAELIFSVFSEPSEDPAVPVNSGDNTVINPERRTATVIAGVNSVNKRAAAGKKTAFNIAAKISELPESSPTSAEFSEVEDCYRGTITYVGDLDSNNIGYVIADHNDCVLDNRRTNGRTRLDIYEYLAKPGIIANGKLEYKRLTTTYGVVDETSSGDFDTTISGTVDFQIVNVEHAVEKGVSNVVIQIHDTGEMTRFADFTRVIQYKSLDNQVPVSIDMSGRVYDSALGYIDVETLSPILMNPDEPSSPAFGGQFSITGASGAQALITLLGGHIIFAQLDADGDNAYEQSAYFDSSKLLDPVSGDITDSDGDGIPDRWEREYGLAPKINDSSEDSDGDQVSNINEYVRGTAPNNAASVPPKADLRLMLNLDGDPFLSTGEEAHFTFLLQNDGPDAVGLAPVRIDFPSEFRLSSVSTSMTPSSNDTCFTAGNSAFCLFSNLNAGTSRSIVVYFTASDNPNGYSINGEIISSLAIDDDATNDLFENVIEVRPPSAELAITLTDSPDPVRIGYHFEYIVTIENRGDLDAENVISVLTLPEDTILQDSSIVLTNDPVDCEQVDNVVTCIFALISDGSRIMYEHSLVAPNRAGETSSSVIVSSDTLEFVTTDNEATETIQMDQTYSDLYVETSRNIEPGLLVGSSIECDFYVGSHGPDGVRQVQLSIDIPPDVTPSLENVTGDDASCSGSDPVICTGRLSSYGSLPTVSFPCASSVPGIYNITATVSSPAVDENLSNNTVSKSLFYGVSLDDVQSQIDAAVGGATIVIPPGFYVGELSFGGKTIRLVSSDGPGKTYLSLPGYSNLSPMIWPGPEGEISGFTFTHSYDSFVSIYNSNVAINNSIFENRYTGNDLISISGTSNPVIENNIFRNNYCRSGGINVSGKSSPVFRNNLFENNDCDIIYISTSSDSPGLPQVLNNTIVGNRVGLYMSGPNGVFRNNIIYGNDIGINVIFYECNDVCNAFQSNLVFNNETDYGYFDNLPDQTGLNGNISVDPLFVGPENSDYRLSVGSLAIDAGNAEDAPTDDLLGNPRPVDGNGSSTAEPDIGAYEFQSAPP